MASVLSKPVTTPVASGVIAIVLMAAIAVIFGDTLVAMAAVWRSSESFAHGPLIPLASIWLAWRKRAELASVRIAPFWPALPALAGLGFAWMAARLAGVNTVEQFALVGMLPCLITLVFGWRMSWALAFPLLFLFFAVPFGMFMLPTLMEWTADFTAQAVRLSGIPILREGNNFELPTGRWSVVESCSGIRYLLAAMPLAFLYSYLQYASWRNRVIFIALTASVSLVANWVRAYLIVMLGHLSGMRIAVGVDHLVYGWLFFGVVIALIFWVGTYLKDPVRHARTPSKGPAAHPPAATFAQLAVATISAIAVMAVWPQAVHALRGAGEATVDLTALRSALLPTPAPDARTYAPQFSGAASQAGGRSPADPRVQARVLHYIHQGADTEMVHDGNRPIPGAPDDPTWQIRSTSTIDPRSEGSDFPPGRVAEHVVVGPGGATLVWAWYVVDDTVLSSPVRVKLHTALALLRGHSDESLAWFIWTPLDVARDVARRRLATEAVRLGAIPIDRRQ